MSDAIQTKPQKEQSKFLLRKGTAVCFLRKALISIVTIGLQKLSFSEKFVIKRILQGSLIFESVSKPATHNFLEKWGGRQ